MQCDSEKTCPQGPFGVGFQDSRWWVLSLLCQAFACRVASTHTIIVFNLQHCNKPFLTLGFEVKVSVCCCCCWLVCFFVYWVNMSQDKIINKKSTLFNRPANSLRSMQFSTLSRAILAYRIYANKHLNLRQCW